MRLPTRIAVGILIAWCALAAFSPFVSSDPEEIELSRILAEPSSEQLMGRDDLGRSISARVTAGAGVSFAIALSVVAFALLIGTSIGLYSGWKGGIIDLLIVRLMDVFLAFPGILLAIALAGILGPGAGNVVIALTVVGWVGFARLARAQTLSVKHRDHVSVAVALGTPPPVIVMRHILPLISAPIIVEITFGLAGVIVGEAGLSFLGLGIQPPTASWGSMIRDGTRYMLIAPHLVIMPGLALMSVVMALNLVGDRLRDHWQVDRS
jgi:peptide/nickel transport system permease protein